MPYGRYGPWYRGGVPRSYIAPNIFVSVGCAICLVFLAIFMIFAGGTMTGVAYEKPKPPFDTPFFTKGKEDNPIRVIGPIVLGIGCTLLVISISLCCVAGILAKRQENKRREQQAQQPLNSGVVPQTQTTSSFYPQQQTPQGYNPIISPYPQQHAPPQDFNPTYPPQSGYNYPSNPQVNYPPPPPGFYPPTSTVYPPPADNGAPQKPQYDTSGNHPSVLPTAAPSQPYNQNSSLLNDAPPSYEATEKRT